MSHNEAGTFSSQVALITGASRGIGASIARRLADEGAWVFVNFAQRADAAEKLVSEIRAAGGKADVCQFNVSDEVQVTAGFKQIEEQAGRLDILVNNAGIAKDALLIRTSTELWDEVLNVNLKGVFLCSRLAARMMMRQKYGRIVNMSSVIGEMGNAGQSAYSASKSALFGFTKSLARELGSRGITVNAVTPGFIKTEMTEKMSAEQVDGLLARIPLGSLGEAEDVAEAVLFLSSKGARYITGQVLGVNGGLNM